MQIVVLVVLERAIVFIFCTVFDGFVRDNGIVVIMCAKKVYKSVGIESVDWSREENKRGFLSLF